MREYSRNLSYLMTPLVLMEPDLLTASSWQGHIPFAFWIIEALRPRVLVELGTYTGLSYCAFCQAVRELKLSTSCYAVDTWEGDPHIGSYGEEIYHALEEYYKPRYASFAHLIRTTFDQALEHFPDQSIDLLHIDGYHTYEVVKHDFTNWLPKLSHRAVVLFHDTNLRGKDFGVWRFWAEISQQYPHFEFLHAEGLGVLAVGGEPPEPIRWLVNIPSQAPELVAPIRQFFTRLGMAIVEHWLNQEITKGKEWLSGQLQALQKELANRAEHIHALQEAVAIRDGTIQALLEAAAGRDEAVSPLQGELAACRRLIEALQQETQSLQHEIAVREARINSMQQSLSWRLTSPLRLVDRILKIRH